jgi:hypothetical protein
MPVKTREGRVGGRVETMGLEPTTPCVQSRGGRALHAGKFAGLGL